MMHLLIGLGPCPLGALRVYYQASKNIHASSYRVGSLSPRSPFGANEKGLKDEGLGFGFHVSAAKHETQTLNPHLSIAPNGLLGDRDPTL